MECEVGNQQLRCLAIKTHKQRGGLYIVTAVSCTLAPVEWLHEVGDFARLIFKGDVVC